MTRLRTYSIRGLLIAVTIVAAATGWIVSDIRYYERRIASSEALMFEVRSSGVKNVPWYVNAVYRWRGKDEPHCCSGFFLFDGFSTVTDETMAHIASFPDLEQLLLGGEISITDQGLKHLEHFDHLQELDLADAPVSAAAVERLRKAIPNCEIRWQPGDMINKVQPLDATDKSSLGE